MFMVPKEANWSSHGRGGPNSMPTITIVLYPLRLDQSLNVVMNEDSERACLLEDSAEGSEDGRSSGIPFQYP